MADRQARQDIAQRARILVVDDEPQNVRYLQDVLEWAGYEHVEGLTNPLEVLPRFRRLQPDLIILDLLMPELDGFGVLEAVGEEIPADAYLPILVLTSDISREARRRALAAGARDFLTKPMSPTEVRLRVANLLETRFLYLECERLRRELTVRASDSTEESGDLEFLERWGASIEQAAGCGAGHAKRVAWTAAKIAETLGSETVEIELLRRAALLHDLGALAASNDGVQELPSSTGSEHPLEHPEEGARLLEGSHQPVIRMAHEVALALRERWDGEGFPRGLAGDEIPRTARIVAVADYLDELTHGADAVTLEQALQELERAAGTRFDPTVVAGVLENHAVHANL